jgi:glycosyl transferase family 20
MLHRATECDSLCLWSPTCSGDLDESVRDHDRRISNCDASGRARSYSLGMAIMKGPVDATTPWACGMVAPLRDGMNLVAKEYLAAQDPEDPGVLVLSNLAGAARELDAALMVNPYDARGVGHAIQSALTMSLAERRDRHASLMGTLRRHDIAAWASAFIAALRAAGQAAERAA